MKTTKPLVLVIIFAMFLSILSGCGGGSSNTPPQPTITAVTVSCGSTSVQTSQTSQCSATVSGTGSYSSNVNWAVDSGTISSTGLYTAPATVPSSRGATVTATSVQDTTKAGTASITITASPATVGTLVIMATPLNGGPGNGPWQISISATDSEGNALPDLSVSLNASEGTLTSNQGITDSTGTLITSIAPPESYAGEAVAVSATAGTQIAAVNIAFVPSSFSPSIAQLRQKQTADSSTNAIDTFTVPFLYGTSGAQGTGNPFLTPNLCYSNLDLGSTIPTACQPTYSNQALVQTILDNTNTVCKAGAAIADAAGAASCAGIVATVISCAAAPTGIGAAICVGGLTYSGTLSSLCVGFITDFITNAIGTTPTGQTAIDETSIGIQPGPPGLGDEVGLVCDAVAATVIGSGTGPTGTKVTLNPSRSIVLAGNTLQFSSTVIGNNNPNVTWSVNGVTLAVGPFGSITADGLYTAPSAVPVPSHVTIAATSAADASASAPAVVSLEPNSPGTIATVAGNGKAGYTGDNGIATSAQLSDPTGIAFDYPGNMFIADLNNNVIRKVDTAGIITTIAGTGKPGYNGDNQLGTKAQLNNPTHVVFDRTINLYITDAKNSRIREVDALTGEILTVAGDGTAGYSGDGLAASKEELNYPDGVALDSNGNLFIGDALNNRIREVAAATGVITTVAGNGSAGYSADGVPATSTDLNFPSRPFVDAAGNIYIADAYNNRIRKVDATTGIITTIAGTGTAGYSGDGGLAINAQLNLPISLALDSAGNLYIADRNNDRIRAVNTGATPITAFGVTIKPGQIDTVVGTGSPGYSGDHGPATSAQIDTPTGLIIDANGNLFFGDSHNNVVRKVTGP